MRHWYGHWTVYRHGDVLLNGDWVWPGHGYCVRTVYWDWNGHLHMVNTISICMQWPEITNLMSFSLTNKYLDRNRVGSINWHWIRRWHRHTNMLCHCCVHISTNYGSRTQTNWASIANA